MNSVNITENTLANWTVLEHVRTAKRWNDVDREWINLSQELARQSLIALTGEERANKMISNSRIALRRKQDELKQERASSLRKEVENLDERDTSNQSQEQV